MDINDEKSTKINVSIKKRSSQQSKPQKALAKRPSELELPVGIKELNLPLPKRKQRLLSGPKNRSHNLLSGTKHYVLEYLVSSALLVSILGLTYGCVFYLADRATTNGVPPTRDVTLMKLSVAWVVIGSVLLVVLLLRILSEEAKQPKVTKSEHRNGIFTATFWYAIVGTIGFSLLTMYRLLEPLLTTKSWAHAGVYAGASAILAGLHACLLFTLPRPADEHKTRSLLELAVVLPCVLIVVAAFFANRQPAKLVEADHKKLADLVSIKQAVEKKYHADKKLPATWGDVAPLLSKDMLKRADEQKYRYVAVSNFMQRILGDKTSSSLLPASGPTDYFSLCASFATKTRQADTVPIDASLLSLIAYAQQHSLSVKSEHPKGDHCFLVVL